MGKKFHQNRSSLHRFRDKRILAFYTEIQDGRQKWLGNDFGENLPVDSEDTLWVKNFIKIALARSFYCATIAYHVGLNALLVAARHRRPTLEKNKHVVGSAS